jgi:hypothetical protein
MLDEEPRRSGGLEGGLGAEPGEGFVDALLEGGFGTSEDRVGFVHWGDVGAAGGPQCRLRPASAVAG